MDKVKVGIIGCGNISGIYLKNLTTLFEITEVVACADIIPENAKKQAEAFGVPYVCTVEELLANPDISIVVNLTIPKFHYEICNAALEAGKNVYVEKPLSIYLEDGKKLIDKAKQKGLLIGGAPDTFMGGGLQTCRKLIDDGWIGRPVSATINMVGHGPENSHPDPEFFYQVGGGPMFDMAPYYLTALISLMGPVVRVSGSTGISFPQRIITSEKKYGKIINVETPTHITGVLDFESGAIVTMTMSFDVWETNLPRMEIYGTEGTLTLDDPNHFRGPVHLRRSSQNEWSEMPLSHGYVENSRGVGVADMAYALKTGRKHRVSGDMAYHVLEIMHCFLTSSIEGKHCILTSSCDRPAALPLGLMPGRLD